MSKFDKCLSLKVDKLHVEIDALKYKAKPYDNSKKKSRLKSRLRQLERRIPA
jgi:hypothetical protein